MIPISLIDDYWRWPVFYPFLWTYIGSRLSKFVRKTRRRVRNGWVGYFFDAVVIQGQIKHSRYNSCPSLLEILQCSRTCISDNILSRLYYIIRIDVFSTSRSMHDFQTCNAIKTFSWVSFDLKNSGMLIRLMTRPKLKL